MASVMTTPTAERRPPGAGQVNYPRHKSESPDAFLLSCLGLTSQESCPPRPLSLQHTHTHVRVCNHTYYIRVLPLPGFFSTSFATFLFGHFSIASKKS